MHLDKELVAAVATPLVLTILSDQSTYGYAVLERVRLLSDGELEWSDGMLYPLLHRLERLGFVTSEWQPALATEKRRRRYYAVTDEGRAALAAHQRQWEVVTTTLRRAWRGSARLPLALR